VRVHLFGRESEPPQHKNSTGTELALGTRACSPASNSWFRFSGSRMRPCWLSVVASGVLNWVNDGDDDSSRRSIVREVAASVARSIITDWISSTVARSWSCSEAMRSSMMSFSARIASSCARTFVAILCSSSVTVWARSSASASFAASWARPRCQGRS
jgi:hypothetical protein